MLICPDCNHTIPNPYFLPPEKSFWYFVEKTESCWIWIGTQARLGYGRFLRSYAHRFSYELHFGKIPDDKVVCHKCDNPSCIRPDHLFLGTMKENTQDMLRKRRHQHGEKHAHHILTEKQAIEIKKKWSEGAFGADLAKEYGVHIATISDLINGRTWTHLPIMPLLIPRPVPRKKMSLTEEQVKQIRKIYVEEKTSYSKLAKKYDVSKSVIRDVIIRNTWKNLS